MRCIPKCHSKPKTILLTGSTGHVGYRILLEALVAGYRVIAIVRCEAKESCLRSQKSLQRYIRRSVLSFVTIPNFTVAGAFQKAIQGADYVIHSASPHPTGNIISPTQYERYFIRPTVTGTLELLEAASHEASVQRVVITSSLFALMPARMLIDGNGSTGPIAPSDRIGVAPPPYQDEFSAYTAAKIRQLSATERWLDIRKPGFDIVYLHPAFIKGPKDLALDWTDNFRGTNYVILGIALGKMFSPQLGATVHVKDVAEIHVQALSADVPGNKSYILSQPARWNDITEIVERVFPKLSEEGILPNNGSAHTVTLQVDTSETDRIFHHTFMPFEDQVVDVLQQYVSKQDYCPG